MVVVYEDIINVELFREVQWMKIIWGIMIDHGVRAFSYLVLIEDPDIFISAFFRVLEPALIPSKILMASRLICFNLLLIITFKGE